MEKLTIRGMMRKKAFVKYLKKEGIMHYVYKNVYKYAVERKMYNYPSCLDLNHKFNFQSDGGFSSLFVYSDSKYPTNIIGKVEKYDYWAEHCQKLSKILNNR